MWFSHLNIKTQRGRAIMFTSFLFIISIVSFLLIGELHLQSDDIFTKEYSQAAFRRKAPERLIAAHTDDSEITEDALDEIRKIPYVKTADSCSYANDINFYIKQGKDYKFIYGQRGIKGFGQTTSESEGGKLVSFLDTSHFMMSDDNITEKDLAEGNLPQSRNEIVLYSEDKNIIGTIIPCYFTAANIWDTNEYYQADLKISGILKEKTEQVYFSKELCNMLSSSINSGEFLICSIYSDILKDYKQKVPLVPVINDKLSGNEMLISSEVYSKYGGNIFQYRDYGPDNKTKEILNTEEV